MTTKSGGRFALTHGRGRSQHRIAMAVGFLVSFGCSSDKMEASRQHDAETVAAFEGTWTAESPNGLLSFTACENTEAQSSASLTCETKHFVRGDGRSKDEEIDLSNSGCGMGGCDYDVSAFFRGRVQLPNAEPLDAEIVLTLASDNKDNLYDGNYHVTVLCRGSGASVVRIDGDYANGVIGNASIYVDAAKVSSDAGTDGGDLNVLNETRLEFRRADTTNCPK